MKATESGGGLFAFRRRFQPAQRAPRGLLGVAPWVDFVLLVFLVVIQQSSQVLRPGLRMELPPAPFEDGIGPAALVVTVPQEGMYFFQDERLTLDGLSLALDRAARNEAAPALILEADRRISHGTLVSLYNLARKAGFGEVVLTTRLEPAP